MYLMHHMTSAMCTLLLQYICGTCVTIVAIGVFNFLGFKHKSVEVQCGMFGASTSMWPLWALSVITTIVKNSALKVKI